MSLPNGFADTDQILSAQETGRAAGPVPQHRIMEKVNDCMSRRDYAGVERVLLYWLAEARAGGDLRGQLMIENELVGHYRKTGERQKAHESAGEALRLISLLGYENSISAATTWVNIATAYHSFDENEEALALFEQARKVYERRAGTSPALLGGLYNNMGLACAAAGRPEDALDLYRLAMDQMAHTPNGPLEQAITCLNAADAIERRDGMEKGEKQINEWLDRAETLLDTGSLPRDGYYAYVCERCAPVFAYYGYFARAEQLARQAEALYERA